MKGRLHRHQVRLHGQRASENTSKTFIVGHLGNAMMIDNNRQVWLWPPTHLKPRGKIPYQCAGCHSIVPSNRERREAELHCGKVRRQRRRVNTVPKHPGHYAMEACHMEAINRFVKPAHTLL